MKKKCLWCKKNLVSMFGEYDEDSNRCESCAEKQDKDLKKNIPVPGEWSRQTKRDLEHYSKEVLQPKNKDGTVNKKFVQAYGTKTLEKEWKTTTKEIEKITR